MLDRGGVTCYTDRILFYIPLVLILLGLKSGGGYYNWCMFDFETGGKHL